MTTSHGSSLSVDLELFLMVLLLLFQISAELLFLLNHISLLFVLVFQHFHKLRVSQS
jgi:hypothetical protein